MLSIAKVQRARAVLLFSLTIAATTQLLSSALAQSPLLGERPTVPKPRPSVTYLFPEQVSVSAGKPVAVDLHFRVADGLHINSHTPREEALIPTTLTLPSSSEVRLAKADYPPGADFTFAINPKEKLSVYTGEFIIHAQLIAARGEHLIEGSLHYQACNNEQCLPPRSIPVAIDVVAR